MRVKRIPILAHMSHQTLRNDRGEQFSEGRIWNEGTGLALRVPLGGSDAPLKMLLITQILAKTSIPYADYRWF